MLSIKAVFFDKPKAPRSIIEKQLLDARSYIDKHPNEVKGFLMLASTYSQMGEYKAAEKEYLKVLKKEKYNREAIYLLAINYETQGNASKAVSLLSNKKFKDDELFVFEIGRLYIKQKKYNKAIEFLNKTLKQRQVASDTLYYLGVAYEKKGQKKKAADYYKKSLEYSPDLDMARKALERVE